MRIVIGYHEEEEGTRNENEIRPGEVLGAVNLESLESRHEERERRGSRVPDGAYFLCPECHSFLVYVVELGHQNYESKAYPMECLDVDHDDDVEWKEICTDEYMCPECECSLSDSTIGLLQFIVVVKNGKITKYGNYWETKHDELREIAEQYGLELPS